MQAASVLFIFFRVVINLMQNQNFGYSPRHSSSVTFFLLSTSMEIGIGGLVQVMLEEMLRLTCCQEVITA